MNKEKKADSSGSYQYVGSGKLSDYKKDGSWIINQMQKGYDNVERGIKVNHNDGHIKFAKTIERIAAKIVKSSVNFNIDKNYEESSKKEIILQWSFSGDLNNVDLPSLEICNSLLISEQRKDLNNLRLSFNEELKTDYLGDSVVDFKESCIKNKILLKANSNKILSVLQEMGFKELKGKKNA